MIDTQEIFTILSRKFQATTQSSDFKDAFNYALTRVLNDLASSKVGVQITAPADVSLPMDADSYYYAVIFDGLIRHIQDLGLWGVDKDRTEAVRRYEVSLNRAHTFFMDASTVETRGGHTTDSDDDDDEVLE